MHTEWYFFHVSKDSVTFPPSLLPSLPPAKIPRVRHPPRGNSEGAHLAQGPAGGRRRRQPQQQQQQQQQHHHQQQQQQQQ